MIGASEGEPEILRDAERVGRGIAEAGAVLVCGGLTGVMEAASRGAAEAGGTVLGVLIFTTLTNVFTLNNLDTSNQAVAKGAIIIAAVLLQQRVAIRSGRT